MSENASDLFKHSEDSCDKSDLEASFTGNLYLSDIDQLTYPDKSITWVSRKSNDGVYNITEQNIHDAKRLKIKSKSRKLFENIQQQLENFKRANLEYSKEIVDFEAKTEIS